jgi:dephospho-CoA kinase
MLRVGITGGIGSGKTALTDWLAQQRITVVDADLAARTVVAPGQPALAEIAAAFGNGYLMPDGQLDRAAVRKLVFADADKRRTLEAITHPRIRQELVRQLSAANPPYAVGIMAAQLGRETRKSRADIVIDNSGTLADLHEKAAILHQTLLARATHA